MPRHRSRKAGVETTLRQLLTDAARNETRGRRGRRLSFEIKDIARRKVHDYYTY
jgi:hypothetical protein